MKTRLSTAFCAVIAAALIAFGLIYGTWSGYREDRAQVDAFLTNGLLDVLSYRAADGLNLCAVAKRHLPAADEDLTKLEAVARKLQQSAGLLPSLDAELEQAFEKISQKLAGIPSFQHSQRDQRYLAMLTADLASLRASEAVTAYNEAAKAYNEQLNAPIAGPLAQLLGIEACPLYERGGVSE